MKTDNRKFTSPENAKLSTGPKTEEGKRKSSANALNHGAYSQRLILPGENPDDLQQLVQDHYHLWRPQNPIEQHLVREMALVMWRQQRISRSENALLDIQMQRMQPGLEAEFAGLTPEALYALAHHALLSHNGAASALARQERRLLRQYAQLRTELEALRNQPPVEQPADHPITPTHLYPPANTEGGKTNLTPPPPISLKVTNPESIIYKYMPPALKPPATDQPTNPERTKAAS